MTGLEASFLEKWTGWDECDTFSLQFYKPVYRKGVGIPDDVIELAGDDSCFVVDGSESKIYIYDVNGEEIMSADIKLVIK